jgi:hypothetical protein
MTLRNRGASVPEIARQTGLSEVEAVTSLRRVTNRFGRRQPLADRKVPGVPVRARLRSLEDAVSTR